ncbi:MAG TPA: hypothetical protein VLA34_08030 [Candidatus Krumholzibacterium sp.]|nr:hypothetical protein [Candidatus Krumholzibacterium sp.]
MKRGKTLSVLVSVVCAVFILCTAHDLNAQSKKEKSSKRSGRERKNEQQVQGEDSAAVKTRDMRKTRKDDPDSQNTGVPQPHGRKKDQYRPKKLKVREEAEWEGGTPPGWSRGTKTGWSGEGAPPGKMKEDAKGGGMLEKSYPPGAGDWSEADRQKWDSRLEEAKERVRVRTRQREGATEEDVESAVRSVEGAAREGVPVERAESSVRKAVDRSMRGEEIEKVTRAISYGADKNVDYGKLDEFIDRRMESGERGDDLAVSIYKEVDSGNLEKAPEEKLPWWKRMFRRN